MGWWFAGSSFQAGDFLAEEVPASMGVVGMVQAPSLLVRRPIQAAVYRYGIALLTVSVVFLAICVLRRFGVRVPFASVFLSAIAVSFLYRGTGPGALALVLSSLSLPLFLHIPGDRRHVALHDLPVFLFSWSSALRSTGLVGGSGRLNTFVVIDAR